jgi:hypothetical protein
MRAEAAIRLLSHAVVTTWIASYLAWTAVSTEPELARAPVAPVPEPAAAEPAPAPRPTQERDAGVPPVEAVRIGEAERDAGRALLAGEAELPALSSTYEDFPSFRSYAERMRALGARFVVVQHRRIVGGVDLASGGLFDLAFDSDGGPDFSPIPRDYAQEPSLAPVAAAARRRHGPGAEIRMLVPRELDAALFGAVAALLDAEGGGAAGYREVRGRYEPGAGGGVRFLVESALRADGVRVPLRGLFELSAPDRSAGSRDPA